MKEENMVKFQITLILILICTSMLVSCEYASNVMRPEVPDPGKPDPGEMMPPVMEGPSVVINELMADNDNTIADPQGDYDDWLELHNRTDSPIMLTGMYLSDKEDNPTKWQFPDGTEIPANGYLIVWLDEDHDDETATEGIHANFKLSKSGEVAMLVDTDANGNKILDSITFGEQETDVSFGRLPNGTGDFQVVPATPGAENIGE